MYGKKKRIKKMRDLCARKMKNGQKKKKSSFVD